MFEIVSSFFTPLLWPLPHIIQTIRLKGSEPSPVLIAEPYLNLAGHFAASASGLRSVFITLFLIYGLYDGDNYPAFGRASTLSVSWMWPIVLRNIVGTFLICGFWDWWLYFGPMKAKLFKFKIVPKYPSAAQMRHDIFYTMLASTIAAFIEVMLCHFWATGFIPMARSLNEKPSLHLLLAFTLRYWRVVHFHITHRLMHPWRTDYLPDFGKFLYRHVHALHHKSYNITAFSGTNMHPVESAVYFSAAFIVLPLGVHPIFAVALLVDLAIGAWVGHDGHVFPGAGNYYHTLHHLHFDCNYGTSAVPLDYWTGTFAASKEDVAKIWGNRPSGREANETFVHSDSSSNKVK